MFYFSIQLATVVPTDQLIFSRQYNGEAKHLSRIMKISGQFSEFRYVFSTVFCMCSLVIKP